MRDERASAGIVTLSPEPVLVRCPPWLSSICRTSKIPLPTAVRRHPDLYTQNNRPQPRRPSHRLQQRDVSHVAVACIGCCLQLGGHLHTPACNQVQGHVSVPQRRSQLTALCSRQLQLRLQRTSGITAAHQCLEGGTMLPWWTALLQGLAAASGWHQACWQHVSSAKRVRAAMSAGGCGAKTLYWALPSCL